MSLNHHLPTRECASVTALLPLAAHNLLSEQEAARLQTHLATCAHCQAELALDAQIEGALRRSYAPSEEGRPLWSREEITALLSAPEAQAAPEAGTAAQPARSAPPAIPTSAARSIRRLGGLPALAATLVVILLAIIIFGIPGLFPGLHKSAIQPQPTATPQPPRINLAQYSLHDISMVSPTEGWVVGNTWTAADDGSARRVDGGIPVILHYQSGRWTPEPLPDFSSLFGCSDMPTRCPMVALRGISMLSAEEGWAVGSTVLGPYADGDTSPIALHYTGGKWTWADKQEVVSGISTRSATDAWAFKWFTGDSGLWAVAHYDGHSWTPMSDPLFAGISPHTLAETPDGEVWISGTDYNVQVGNGYDGNEPAVFLHYDGQRWSKIDPHMANAWLASMAFVSPDEGWAVGTLPNNQWGSAYEVGGLILHYINGVWQQQELFKNPLSQSLFSFYSVAMVSSNEGWAVGDEGVILHYHNGAWGEFQNPTGQTLYSVVMVSPDEGWAVGDGVMLHYQAGSWRVYNG
jgi:hypothetical protein